MITADCVCLIMKVFDQWSMVAIKNSKNKRPMLLFRILYLRRHVLFQVTLEIHGHGGLLIGEFWEKLK